MAPEVITAEVDNSLLATGPEEHYFSAAEIHEGSKQRRGRTALHLALTDNDCVAAARLIETGSPALLNRPSAAGCTPLMLLAMGHCKEELIWRLLERNGTASVAERSETRRTAADYASEKESGRSPEVVAMLRDLEQAEVKRTAPYRCSICGDLVKRRPLLAFFWERAEKGDEDNEILQRFFSRRCHRQLLDPRCHQINDTRRVRKEVSESMAVLEALERALPDFGHGWHLIDLCCGRSISAAVASLRYQGVKVTAVDKLEPRFLPHCTAAEEEVEDSRGGSLAYAQMDVLSQSFTADLERLVRQAARPAALLGMHLCGRLSLQAVDAFAHIDAVQAAVLSPCCLPSKTDPTVPQSLFCTRDSDDQYQRWAVHLEAALRESAANSHVTREAVVGILSPKNIVICATKHHAVVDGAGPGEVASDAT